jgi:hypothetical protein
VRLGFMDNLYLNLMPSKPGGTNGSGLIASYSALAQALKQCARLREKFLPYFTEGTLIGECLLAEEPSDAHVTAYVLPGKSLLIVLNEGLERPIPLSCELAPWIKSASANYEVRSYNTDGQLLAVEPIERPTWRTTTPRLARYDLVLYEIETR